MTFQVSIPGLLLLSSVCLFAEEKPALRFPELFHVLSHEHLSPHIPWAKPHAGRKLKAVVIGPRWGQRETVELMARFDIDCHVVMLQSGSFLYNEGRHWGHQKVPSIWEEAVLKKLRDALDRTFDVIIMGKVAANQLPDDIVDKLISRVQQGAGLVYLWPRHLSHARLLNAFVEGLEESPDIGGATVAVDDSKDDGDLDEADFEPDAGDSVGSGELNQLVTGIPLEALAGFGVTERNSDLAKVITARSVGKGRAVCINYASSSSEHFLTPADDVDLHYEYYQSFLIKAILWSAKVEPTIRFSDFPNAIAGDSISFELQNSGETQAVGIALTVRSPDPFYTVPQTPNASPGLNQTVSAVSSVHSDEQQLVLSKGRSRIKFTIPSMPDGEYFLDVRITASKTNINWATTHLLVKSDVKIDSLVLQPDVLDLSLSPPYTIRGTVTLTGDVAQNSVLKAVAVDSHNRVLASNQKRVPKGTKSSVIELQVSDVRSTLLRIRTELVVNERTVDIAVSSMTTRNRAWDDFTFFAWGGVGGGFVGRQRGRMLASLDIDAFRGGASLRSLEVADVRSIADLTRFNSAVEDKVLTPCHSDPDFRNGLRDRITKAVEHYSRFDAFGFLCGDEWAYMQTNTGHDACWSPTCIVRFRTSLEKRYQTIEALNRQWDSGYQAFDEILPTTIGDFKKRVKESGSKNYSPLIDQWVNNYETFADTFRFCDSVLKDLGSGQRMGYTTPLWNWWYRGYNWPDIVPHCGFASPYGPWGDSTHSESARSFSKPGTVLSYHYGSYVTPLLHDEDHFRMVPYTILLNGFSNAFWYTTWDNEGGLSPSLDPYPCLQRSSESIREIKDGLGKLLLGAKRQNDGIAIHYSIPSYLFSFHASGPHVPWRINALVTALQELGYQFDFVSNKQIENGALANYKALIMPVSQCISNTEADQMKRFVDRGGLLLSDIKPGIADEHGKVGAQTIIPELFGLKWDSPLQSGVTREVRLSGTYGAVRFSSDDLVKLSVDPSVSLQGAKSLLESDGLPVLAHHRFGKGAAVCLNYPFSESPELRNVLWAFLPGHGIDPPVKIEGTPRAHTPGAWVSGFEHSRFKDGQATYFGFTRKRQLDDSDSVPGKLTFDLKRDHHLYNMRTGEEISHEGQFETEAMPSSASVFALLPYGVEALLVDVPRGNYSRGETLKGTVKVVTTSGPYCRHVIHIEVIRPDGKRASYLAQNLETTDGTTTFQISFCQNEPTGVWRLTFTDVATKSVAAIEVVVRN